jgi:Ni/Fe-hydrogenase subunit HybB-like protein
LFLGWGLFSGVPLASTGFLMAFTVYLLGLKQFYPLLRPAVLTGFIGYFFAVVFLLVDLGRPWHLPYPMVLSFGTSSVMFLIAWHVALYLSTQFVEFCPAIFEWIGADRFRRWVLRVTIGATIFGVILSTLHQSALGALFLIAPAKVHPLWYSPYLPLLFLVSSIYAGLSMIIVESTVIRRWMPERMDAANQQALDGLALGLGKGAALTMVTYFALKWVALAHGNHWDLLGSGYGVWFLVEMFGLVLTPCFLFVIGVRQARVTVVRVAAVLAILGIVANRLTVTMLAFNWQLPHRELPSWREAWVVLTIVTIEILVYRWIVNRLPVHKEHPAYPGGH